MRYRHFKVLGYSSILERKRKKKGTSPNLIKEIFITFLAITSSNNISWNQPACQRAHKKLSRVVVRDENNRDRNSGENRGLAMPRPSTLVRTILSLPLPWAILSFGPKISKIDVSFVFLKTIYTLPFI